MNGSKLERVVKWIILSSGLIIFLYMLLNDILYDRPEPRPSWVSITDSSATLHEYIPTQGTIFTTEKSWYDERKTYFVRDKSVVTQIYDLEIECYTTYYYNRKQQVSTRCSKIGKNL